MTPDLHVLALLLGTAGGVLVAGWTLALLTRRLRSRLDAWALLHRYCARPVVAGLATVAALSALPSAGLSRAAGARTQHGLTVVLIAAIGWLLASLLWVGQGLVFRRARVDVVDNRRARRLRTQVTLLRNLGTGIVVVLAVAGVLMTFARLRTFGASLLASAGIVGLVAGAAGQTTLKNVFAGLQLAFTDTLRIDDVVVVEDEWGWVESLTLMSVTLHLWDERRLVLPTSYFTTEPFQNWTRHEARVLGSVLLYVDFLAPLDELRREVHGYLDRHPLWDRKDWVLQVVDATPTAMQIRILASAADAPSAWDLRCDVREFALGWLCEHAPEGLPQVRAGGSAPVRSGTEAPLVLPDRFRESQEPAYT